MHVHNVRVWARRSARATTMGCTYTRACTWPMNMFSAAFPYAVCIRRCYLYIVCTGLAWEHSYTSTVIVRVARHLTLRDVGRRRGVIIRVSTHTLTFWSIDAKGEHITWLTSWKRRSAALIVCVLVDPSTQCCSYTVYNTVIIIIIVCPFCPPSLL